MKPPVPMLVLLLGGTSETSPLADAIASAGFAVLVSTATDETLDIGKHAAIERRIGRLDRAGLANLLRERQAVALVDAAHPYAAELHANAVAAASDAQIAYVRYTRLGGEWGDAGVTLAADHEQAAVAAFAFGRPVLLTTGSRNLAPYVRQSHTTNLPLFVRVLPGESAQACQAAGFAPEQIIALRGPFSVQQNIEHIRQSGAGVLVTKDSGDAGGVPEKLEAARVSGCAVVVVSRSEAGSQCSPAGDSGVGEQLRQIVDRLGV